MTWTKAKTAIAVGVGLLLVSGTAIIATKSSHSPGGFEVAGFINQVATNGESSFWCQFSAVVFGEKSLISVQYFNGESTVCGTDGEDSYFLNEMKPARLKNPANLEFGTITTGPFPQKALSAEQLIWVAYASSALRSVQNPKLPIEALQEVRTYCTNETVRFKQSPFLPDHIKWWSPAFKFFWQTNRTYLVDYPDGYLAAEFTATSPTNFSGETLPLGWRYTSYGPKSLAGASSPELATKLRKQSSTTSLRRDDVFTGQTLVCVVTNLSTSNYIGDFLPALSTNVTIADWRLESELRDRLVLPIKTYRIGRNGTLVDESPKTRWLKRSDPELIRLLQLRRQAFEH